MNGHPYEALNAYADGELSPEDASRLEVHLEYCTECMRELAAIRSIRTAMQTIHANHGGRSVWADVHRRITRPVGWILLVLGGALWAGLVLVSWFRQALTLEWAATTAAGVGLAMIAVGIAHEQYREWKQSPYKDIQR